MKTPTDVEDSAQAGRPAGEGPRFRRISDSCYVAMQAEGRSNAGFIIGTESVMVVDCLGSPAGAQALRAEIGRLTGKPIRFVVLTHWHYDHSVGNHVFPEEAAVVSADASAVQLARVTARDRAHMGAAAGAHADAGIGRLRQPTVRIDRVRRQDLGGLEVRLAVAGACHSAGDMVVYVPAEGVLFAGDLVWNGLHPNVAEGGSFAWIDALARLDRTPFEVVVPGHGDVGDAGLLRDQRNYLMTLRRLVKHLARGGAKREDVVAGLPIPPPYEAFGFAAWWPRNVGYVFEEVTSGH